ncbi:hypothetical protein [Erythrobacter sp. EC-HK427]|uniref:hypothetical protein n=1 Tax=Erythrobacter sp. EC-HK427 TaxID=2038396 RepID=UPI0012590EEB|nr:hypothetical protein [Erythrobacter sp. EC-HK427]VVT20593.1 conserved hypothetical protein [Erythrobacter sp. EC-HK427]
MTRSAILASWWRTKRAMRLFEYDLVQLRAKKWAALQPVIAATPALAAYAGRPLAEFPVVEPAQIRADYGRWNALGLSHEELTAMADAAEPGEPAGGLTAGWSTGTGGGARGLFVASPAERADYVGQSLARLLPAKALLQRQRIALHLRANSALYADVSGGRMAFRHFPLEAGIAETAAALDAFAPTILIAPPHRLLALAKAGAKLPQLRHLLFGSEPMSPKEQAFVGTHFGVSPRAIYQATEGFLGAECAHGLLHPNHHAIAFELVFNEAAGCHQCVVTDLHRHSQPIVRVLLDDVIEIARQRWRCLCGMHGLAIKPPQGRVQDIWHYPHLSPVAPGRVVKAVEGPLGGKHAWRAVGWPQGVVLTVDPAAPDKASATARDRLAELVPVAVELLREPVAQDGPKRRKVAWHDG